MHTLKLLVLMTVPALMISVVAAQTPNFSGTWSHTGNAKAQWVSMAGINCGPECTITQNEKTLTLTRPANQAGAPDTGLVVLNLDGRDMYRYPVERVEVRCARKVGGGQTRRDARICLFHDQAGAIAHGWQTDHRQRPWGGRPSGDGHVRQEVGCSWHCEGPNTCCHRRPPDLTGSGRELASAA